MDKNLHFETNSRHIGQLGRELVTDFVTALVELIKNSYDADAGSVKVIIENAKSVDSRIIILDTGTGMTQEEFEKRWMVIGTNNKVSNPYTAKGRKKAGKKGIGRFSVERLAKKTTIYSFNKDHDFKVFINWNLYEEISVEGIKQRIGVLRKKADISSAQYIGNQLEYFLSLPINSDDLHEVDLVRDKLFLFINNYEELFLDWNLNYIEDTVLPILQKYENVELKIGEIDNPLVDINDRYSLIEYDSLCDLYSEECRRKTVVQDKRNPNGLVIVLEGLRDLWRQKDIDKLQKDLRLLVAPDLIEKNPFHIDLIANDFEVPAEISLNSILDLRFGKMEAKIINGGRNTVIHYSDQDGSNVYLEETYQENPLVCGDLSFELYYFLRDSAHLSISKVYTHQYALNVLNTYGGIKIYRDGFRVKPYGDIGNDWLELDKEKISDTHGYRVGNNQTIGVVRISDVANPLLVDATNREGIIENEAYETLKEFIISCLNVISNQRKKALDQTPSKLQRELDKKKEQDKKDSVAQTKRDKEFQKIVDSLKRGETEKAVVGLEKWKKSHDTQQAKQRKQQERLDAAYEEVVKYQETELVMYKNLATLGIMTASFGHETLDVVSRITNIIKRLTKFKSQTMIPGFETSIDILEDDFGRIEGYSTLIDQFLKKKKRSPEVKLDCGEVLRDVCSLYNGMLASYNISLIPYADENIFLTMRRIDLESIIINMITNAFEQVKDKGNGEIRISFHNDESEYYFYFEDNGTGVPENKKQLIFRAFETSKENGIGLGLNIVKDIIERYNGGIHVTNSENLGGAKFIVHFRKNGERTK